MSTTTVNVSPISQQPVDLSETQNLVKTHNGLDAMPGYVVVVFEKLEHGGAKFAKIVNSDERFKKFFFWSSPQKYFAVAVNQSVLSYSFSVPVTLDDDIRQFTLVFHLTFRASNPRVLAELNGQDPLRRLTDMIGKNISRSCRPRKWEMVKERFRELERVVLDAERPKITQYATSLGLEVISLELDRRLPEKEKEVDVTRLEVDKSLQKDELLKKQELELTRSSVVVDEQKNQLRDRAAQAREDEIRKRSHRIEITNLDQKFDVEDRELERQLQRQDQVNILHQQEQNRRLTEMKTEAIGTAITNVGRGINTPAALQDGFNVAQEMSRAWRGDNGALPAGLPGSTPLGLPAKEDTLSSLLVQGLGEVGSWPYPDAQQRALRSTILHIIAEALLSEDANDATLQQYVDKLNELGSNLNPPPTQTQFKLLNRFRNIEALKSQLG